MVASQDGHVEVVRLLLARQGVEVNKTAQNGSTALLIASQKGHVQVVQLLLARQGVEVNKTTPAGCTALMSASDLLACDVGTARTGRAQSDAGPREVYVDHVPEAAAVVEHEPCVSDRVGARQRFVGLNQGSVPPSDAPAIPDAR